MAQAAPKDFELAVSELIDGYRKTGNQENIAMALETQANLVRRDETWPAVQKAAEKAQKALGIQPSRPTEAEMKNALAANEALQGGQNLGLEADTTAPKSQADMEPIDPPVDKNA